jgi:agmatine deiminase
MTHDRMEQHLRDTLGVQRIVWLPGGMADDDTDGHVDTVARFIGPNLVAAVRAEPGHPDHDVLAENRRRLVEAGYGVVDLPLPARRTVTYPDAGGFGAGQRVLTQTYANFLFVNGTLRVPVYGDPQDEVALRRLDDALPGFRVEPVSSRWLIVGGGSLHCLSVQQPVRRG